VKMGMKLDNLIKAYHLDEHRGNDGQALRDRLMYLSDCEADHVSIFLYALPQSLQVGTVWYYCLSTFASLSLINAMKNYKIAL
jgi:hypothetical protein